MILAPFNSVPASMWPPPPELHHSDNNGRTTGGSLVSAHVLWRGRTGPPQKRVTPAITVTFFS